jgi:hypothetical protein
MLAISNYCNIPHFCQNWPATKHICVLAHSCGPLRVSVCCIARQTVSLHFLFRPYYRAWGICSSPWAASPVLALSPLLDGAQGSSELNPLAFEVEKKVPGCCFPCRSPRHRLSAFYFQPRQASSPSALASSCLRGLFGENIGLVIPATQGRLLLMGLVQFNGVPWLLTSDVTPCMSRSPPFDTVRVPLWCGSLHALCLMALRIGPVLGKRGWGSGCGAFE